MTNGGTVGSAAAHCSRQPARLGRVSVVVQALLAAFLVAAHAGAVASDGVPAWSPDGRQIAFVRFDGRSSSAYVVRADGRALRRVSKSGVNGRPAWSPDSRTLAIVRSVRGGSAIDLVRVGDRRERQLVLGRDPAWSPDGRRIAFVQNGERLAVVDVGTRRVRTVPLETSGTWIGGPAWSPDGRRLALNLGGTNVAVVGNRGGRALVVGGGGAVAWSPDGRLLAAACRYGQLVGFFDPDRHGTGCAVGIPEASTGRPQWAPAGDRVVASGCFFERCSVWTQPRGGPTKTLLGAGVAPSWSRDGRTIVFAGGTPREWRLYLIGSDGTGLRRLLP
jgi:Tol biopolymer transport system component